MKALLSLLGLVIVIAVVWLAVSLATPPVGTADVATPVSPDSSEPAATGIPADATEAIVEYVHDGDTLFLEDGRKVRLLGVNTPELGDCWGDEATGVLRGLLPEGTHVWVAQDVEALDQYGRSLLFIYTDDGANVNLALLSSGAAEVEMYSPNLRLQDEIHDAEDAARSADLGLWAACR